MSVDLKILKAGYCVQKKSMVIPKSKGMTNYDAKFALIKHYKYGYILFDTGYSEYFFEATKKFPYSIYGKITPVYLNCKESAVKQLLNQGIKSEEINYIVISHFHADHISGLKEFNKAKFICSKKSYDYVKNRRGFSALLKAFLPDLIPDDFADRLLFIEDMNNVDISKYYTPFNVGYDLFGDGLIIATFLEGHAVGQIGLFVKSDNKDFFLISDACWSTQSYEDKIMPPLLSCLVFDNVKEYKSSLYKIYDLHKNKPEILIVPTHCSNLKL